MSISFNHTAIQAQRQQKQILNQVKTVIQSGIFLEGTQNKILTKKLAQVFKTKYVVPVASGHDALLLALATLHLKPDDEVIIPANSYPTAFAAHQAGCTVVLADVDLNGQVTLAELQKRVTPHTKAVIVVHLYGLVGELKIISQWLKKAHITLIEDCAQAFGTTLAGKSVGTFGQLGCFSFYPTKNLGTLGDGGAVITQSKRDYEYLLQAKAYGEKQKYQSQFLAGHSRLPEIQAAVLNLYLKDFRKVQRQRAVLAKYFHQQIKRNCLDLFITPLLSHQDSQPTQHLFVIRAKWRDQLHENLRRQKIETSIHYPIPVHQVQAFQQYEKHSGQLSNSVCLSQEILSLPFHQFLSKKDVDLIIKALKDFYFAQLPEPKSITFLFPAYNDAKSIPALIEKANRLGILLTKKYQIIVVNDGSQDNTKQVLRRLQQRYRHLKVIQHQKNQGYGGALRTGFMAAQTEWLFYTDGDGQFDPNEIVLLLQQLKKHPDHDVINGFKQNRDDSLNRQILGSLYNNFLHRIYPIPIKDIDCDFRLMKVKKLQQLQLQSKSAVICLELVSQFARSGASFCEVGVSHFARQYGHSQFFRPKHLWNTLVDQVFYFFRFYFGFYFGHHYATKYHRVKKTV